MIPNFDPCTANSLSLNARTLSFCKRKLPKENGIALATQGDQHDRD